MEVCIPQLINKPMDIRLGRSKPFHWYTPSEPSNDQPGQGLLQKNLIWNSFFQFGIKDFLLPNALPQGQLTEVPLYFEIFNIKVDGQTI